MVSLEEAVIARLQIGGRKFEILVDPERALSFRRGAPMAIENVLATPFVFRDVRAAERVAEHELKVTFGTTDVNLIAQKILREGEIQLTTEQRRAMVKKKKAQIAHIISRRGIDPHTDSPHPPDRILRAMDEAGVKVDPFVEAEQQVEVVVRSISTHLPIKLQRRVIRLRIPPQFASKIYPLLKKYGEFVGERWLADASLEVDVRILAGLQEEMFRRISVLTSGNFTSRVIEREDVG
jgi:ribosome maturation protein SDO1